ncbi:MAG: C13 family peptidase [Muribaculaceae bacterium]|nr:C13 family peptidase [Muribaculaceae bacterium]
MKKHLLITLICFLFPVISAGAQAIQAYPVSKGNAINTVKNHFAGRDVDYYIQKDGSPDEWVFFVDAEPMKGWEHECYRVTVPRNTTSLFSINISSITTLKTPPPGDFEPVDRVNRYGSYATIRPIVPKSGINNGSFSDNDNTYAIILSGGICKEANHIRYWNDCSFIYQTLVNKYGIPKNHIYPLMADGDNPAVDTQTVQGQYISQSLDLDLDGENEISLAATKTNFQSTLNTIKQQIGRNGQLFLYVIDHGGSTDFKSKSYICLWGNQVLHDTELTSMLEPFTQKMVNVNVVLGQCHSGGFIDNLTQAGCVVAAACAGNESSYACTDIPFDEFVYQWTCAVNEANHMGQPVAADIDLNGKVTMLEAFQYAKDHDRISPEHPQYRSNPQSIGEDMALNYIPPSFDLYIKDNPEDTGKEPNRTTKIFWDSPSVWIRNARDTFEIHENPIFDSVHIACTIKVKIHNRGKHRHLNSQWLHVYWAKASTAFCTDTWKGLEYYKPMNTDARFVTGGHLSPIQLPVIEPGDSVILNVPWLMPTDAANIRDENHRYCIKARLSNSSADEDFENDELEFDVLGRNNEAQKNVSIIYKYNIGQPTNVYIRNPKNTTKKYTLELVPRTQDDRKILKCANMYMKFSDKIFDGWKEGGLCSTGLDFGDNPNPNVNPVYLQCKESEVTIRDVVLNAKEFDTIGLRFDFLQGKQSIQPYVFDLIQKDEEGNVIGGETFKIESPAISLLPIEIESEETESDEILLTVNNDNFTTIKWIDESNNTIGTGETITVTPGMAKKNITAVGFTAEGDIANDTYTLGSVNALKNVTVDNSSKLINVEFSYPTTEGGMLTIMSVENGVVVSQEILNAGVNQLSIPTSPFDHGFYSISYTLNDETLGYSKIKINQ